MPGRNEPCPCGSGKKFKKCCGKEQAAGTSRMIETELLAINEEFQSKGLTPETIIWIEGRISKWLDELRGVFPDEFIEQAAYDTYMFLEHPADWRAFLDKQLRKHPGGKVAETLEAWRRPFLLLAKAERVEDGRLIVKDEVDGRFYKAVQEDPDHVGQWFLGVAFPYPVMGDDAITFTYGTMYLKRDTPPHFIRQLKEYMPSGDLLGLLKLLVRLNDEENEAALPPFEQKVLGAVERYLAVHPGALGLAEFTEELLRRMELNARKPEAVAAGIVQAATEIGVVPKGLTQKELAAEFGVSVATMLKYRDIAIDFIGDAEDGSDEVKLEQGESGRKGNKPDDGNTGRILQFKVKLMRTSPPVWRRLLVDSRMSFANFHHVLQAAFDWDGDHLHSFRMTRIDGKSGKEALIEPSDEHVGFLLQDDTLEEQEERLADWFRVEKDRAVYTYDFGADWEHEIVLKKRLPVDPAMYYPWCVKAVGEAPDEYDFEPEDPEREATPEEMTDVVNDLLEMLHADPIQEEPEDNGANPGIWQQLLTEMVELRELEPWKWLYDDEIFVVEDPVHGTPLFVSVLGAGGEEFGLAVYIGEEGYESLLNTMSQSMPTEELVFGQRSILASFSDRDELEKDDLQLLKDLGRSFRGKKKWPMFRSFVPGYYPWTIDAEEARLLVEVIGQTKAVLKGVMGGLEILVDPHSRAFFGRRMNESGEWQAGRFVIDEPADPEEGTAAELIVPETDIARLKKLKASALQAEFGLFHVNYPVQDEPDERPYFPLIIVGMDHASGLTVYQDITGRKAKAEAAQQGLRDFIEQQGGIPESLWVTAETERLVRPLVEELKLRVVMKKTLPELERLKKAMAGRF
ncbi:plasmid pRiA4b ORF-3 family protein [Planococcus lenghuensis]|nr:plasmid pRiA4b ORF-3 family protein [Planococcus lenghuensis]